MARYGEAVARLINGSCMSDVTNARGPRGPIELFGRSWTEVGPRSSFCFYLAATLRGRPPRRPFARELAALRSLVRRPTNAAAVTKCTFGLG